MLRTAADIPDGSDAHVGSLLVSQYHGGQFTALYALSSSGSLELYPGEGVGRLVRELGEAINIAENCGEDYAESDAHYLRALLAWVESN